MNLLSLRQVDRKIEASTRILFQRTYFATRNLVIDERAISELTKVGDQPEFAGRARHLHLISYHLPDPAVSLSNVRDVDPRLGTPSLSATKLVPALRNLTNLKSIDFNSKDCATKYGFAARFYDHRHQEPHDHYDLFFATTIAAKACGLRLEKLSGLIFDLTGHTRSLDYGMSRIEHAFCGNPSLSTLTFLDVTLRTWRNHYPRVDDYSLATRLASSLNSLEALHSLSLRFGIVYGDSNNNPDFFSHFAASLKLPLLASFTISHFAFQMVHMLEFLDRQAGALRDVSISDAFIDDDLDEEMVREFLTTLHGLRLRTLRLDGLYWDEGTLGFGVHRLFRPESRDCVDCADLRSEKEVREGLAKMIEVFVLNVEDWHDADENDEEGDNDEYSRDEGGVDDVEDDEEDSEEEDSEEEDSDEE